jgi:hypothetical protein
MPRYLESTLLVADGPDADTVAITLKKQTVPRLNPQHPTNLDGHGDLSLATDLGLFLHGGFRFLTLSIPSFLSIF